MSPKTLDQYIACSPGICGGQPHLAGHRITVHQIVVWYDRMGLSADEIATNHGLSVAAVHAALAYYFDHRDEVEQLVVDNQEFIEQLKQSTPSKLHGRLGQDAADAS
ncbi:DUF433 domain-containing protein [Aeoliella mucimassa]|uniref:DUF433 domain-containing protein n=1 Tax=Aeoliella mucimassa TaxID=2527972 RepID=A0A518AT28_9BACT|nr:DUF433 domain-containing protein [Aeoliella mucimassa]QDU57889.1 hypothetical protein Pan181_41120 [Aeoliella mucimassa]